ncbi:oligosaccharide repeat unit polymerase [Pseudanabaenaceae cyanobacterium LEGE 13415]|nr:oligosaccharide repeat unit polymerase [Pseudanabaenaceae cyanobacterium LEGE 13415]
MNYLDRPLSRPVTDESIGSPFVSMKKWHRAVVVSALSAYLLWIALHGVAHPVSTASGEVLLVLALNFALLLLPVIFYQPTFGWFHPLVFGIVLTFVDHLTRSGLYINGLQWHAALPGWNSDRLNQLVVQELLLSSLGIVSAYLGFFLCPRLGIPKLTFHRPRYIGRKVVIAVIFAMSTCMAYLQSQGGIATHILSWGRGRRTELAGESYWGFFVQVGIIACLSWLALDRRATQKPLFWVCSVSSLTMSFLVGGSRSILIYYMVMGLMVWLLRERKISFTKPLILVCVSFFLIGLLGAFRTSTFSGEINWGLLTGESTTEESALTTGAGEVSMRLAEGNAVYPILALVPETIDHIHGSSYAAVLALPVPRTLWADKPGLIGGRVGMTFFNQLAGVPPGPIGEAFWNFGVSGVLIAFVLFGMAQRWFVELFCHYAHEPVAIILYAVTLFQFSEPSSAGLQAFAITIVLTLIFLRLIGAMTFRKRTA